jgi:Flp pilus assembly protein TadG
MKLSTSRSSKRQRGATLVEQALMLPILAALFFGIVDMGRALYSYSYVSYITREATRWASVRSTNSFNGSSAGQVQTFVSSVTGLGLDPAAITSRTNYIPPANGTPLCPGGTGVGNNKPGCVVQVTVNYNFKFLMPFLPAGRLNMSSESQMIITE